MLPDLSRPSATSVDTAPLDAQLLGDAAGRLQLSMTDDQIDRLLRYRDLLLKWNKTYNLTAIRQPEEALKQHVVDCLGAVGPIQRYLDATRQTIAKGELDPPSRFRLLDVGSGGGLPGVVIAQMLPELDVDCVDAVGKKAAFIRQVGLDLHLPNLKAIHARVEDMRCSHLAGGGGYDLIVSRAFSSLTDFTRWTEHLLAPGGVWLAMKGQRPNEEQDDPKLRAQVFHVEQLQIPGLDAQRCLVWMKPPAAPEKHTRVV